MDISIDIGFHTLPEKEFYRYFCIMNTKLPIIASVLLVASCGHDEKRIQEDTGLSYHQQACMLRYNDAPAEDFIAMQQKAVDELRAGKSSDNPIEVLAQMGYFYSNIGDYVNAIEYLQEAESYLLSHPEYELTEGSIQLYGDLGNIYYTLGIQDKSLEAYRKGICISRQLGGRMLSDLYRFAAATYSSKEQPDSVLECYTLALKAIDDGGTQADKATLRELIMCEKADYIINSGIYPDSIKTYIGILERLNHPEAWAPAYKKFTLGNAYTKIGKSKEGIRMMEEALDEVRHQGDTESQAMFLKPLMQTYAANGMAAELLSEFPIYDELSDTLLNREKLMSVIGSDMRYRTSKSEDEAKLLKLKLSLTHQRIISGIAIVVLLLSGIILFVAIQRRNHRKQIQLQCDRIQSLIADRIALNNRIEQLNRPEGNKSIIQPILLEKADEVEFRKTFNNIYPHFISDLRRDVPGITSGNELICMMIYLRKSNDEISLAMGISRESVIKSRYRLRQRLALAKEDDLDSFICNR